jgi:hypothetical protein
MLVEIRERRMAWLEEYTGKSNRKGEEKDRSSIWQVQYPQN